jgi:hypothetical protein
MITLQPLDPAGLAWAQATVSAHHYLHRPVDPRTMPAGYSVHLTTSDGRGLGRPYGRIGLLIFGRPECTRLYPWFAGVDEVAAGRAACTRWEVLNLSRVWFDPIVQPGGPFCDPGHLPGFYDRRGAWRSTLASTVIGLALAQVGVDYLVQWPPCFLEEPYQVRWALSYCDPTRHRGTIYRAAGFELYRCNERGLQTWRIPVAPLSAEQDARVVEASLASRRSQTHRNRRSQLALPLMS